MTLQQKLLAKQSKKGFTLVELVVVIAILGILAAIAIPAVIGIINSANESQAKSDASVIDHACKDYYSEVVGGTLNSANPGKVTTDSKVLPAANASASAKKSAALNCTVQGALEYAGVSSTLAGKITDFGYDADGNVFATVDKGHKVTAFTTTNTKFSAMNYK